MADPPPTPTPGQSDSSRPSGAGAVTGASARPRPKYRKSVRLLAALLVLVPLALCLEIFFYYYGLRYRDLYRTPLLPRMDLLPQVAQLGDAQRFVESGRFDPDLGWDIKPIARNLVEGKTYLAQAYGDSFTQGAEVEDAGTWQDQFEAMTGRAILNLGCGGFGLDQAVLKFEKYGSRFATPYVILGFNSPEYRRLVSYHSFFHFKYDITQLYAFKPIFVDEGAGPRLVKPPCDNAPCLYDALVHRTPELDAFMQAHDFWYRDYLAKPAFRFPYTLSFARAFPFWLHMRGEHRGQEDYFFVNSWALQLAKHLTDRFAARCESTGAKPLCLILNRPTDLRLARTGVRWDQPLLDHFRERNIPFVDTTAYILEKCAHLPDFRLLTAPDDHFNEEGNKLIAEALAEYFRDKP